MEAAGMKLILWSVFLAHGAVVYTVCAPLAGGVWQVPNNLDICVIPVVREAGRPGSPATSQNKKKQPVSSMHLLNSTKRSKIPVCPLRGQPGRHTSLSCYGWQIVGDLSLNTNRDTTIHFTIDALGHITKITVTPFTANAYRMVYAQLKQIRFTWRGPTLPPISTTFEKKICIR
jgi:hypothetical protein